MIAWFPSVNDATVLTRFEEAVIAHSLAEGLRVVTVLLHPYIPAASSTLLEALGQPGADALLVEQARFGARPGGSAVERLPPLFPKVEQGEVAA